MLFIFHRSGMFLLRPRVLNYASSRSEGPGHEQLHLLSLSQFYFQVKSAAQHPKGFPINYDRKVKTAIKQVNRTEETKFKIGFPYANNRDLKIRRRRRQRERHKSNRFTGNTQNNNFARASHFLYISLPFLHDYDVKMPHFMFYTGRKQATTKFSFSFMTWIRQLEIQLQDNTGTVNA